MAEVSNLHRLNHHHHHSLPLSRRSISSTSTTGSLQEDAGEEEEEEGFYHHPNPLFLNFDSFSSAGNPSNPAFFDDHTSSFNFDFEVNAAENLDSEYEDPNCFSFGGEEDEEQMNFVTDLFESRETLLTEDPIWEFDSEPVDESGLEFGFGPGIGSNGGLRVVDMDSDSDSEEFDVNSGFVNNDDDSYDGFEVNNDNYHSANEREEFEWEEVSERLHFDEVENLNSVIDRIEEISVSSDISSSDGGDSRLGDDVREEDEGNIEWEVLLAMNNLERNFELENSAESIEESGIPHGNLRDREDYILALEYDTLFGQLVENENALKGSPPAAKSVVENLPSVVFSKEEVEENSCVVSCAVCMDEFAVGEKLTRMPCFHLYHGECILPWLHSRNTCPVCRYELPTDDADYERRRFERGGGGLSASRLAILSSIYIISNKLNQSPIHSSKSSFRPIGLRIKSQEIKAEDIWSVGQSLNPSRDSESHEGREDLQVCYEA